ASSSAAATAAIRSLPMARYANGVRPGTPEEAAPMSIAASEQAVVDAVTPRLFIGGDWRDAGEGDTLAGGGPAPGAGAGGAARRPPARGGGRPGRGRRRPGRVARPPAPGAGRDPAPGL